MTREPPYPRLGRPGDPDAPLIEIVPFPPPARRAPPGGRPTGDAAGPSVAGVTASSAATPAGGAASPEPGATGSGRFLRQLSRAVPLLIVIALIVAVVATVVALLNGGDDGSDLSRADVGGVTQSAPTTGETTTVPSVSTTADVAPTDLPDGWIAYDDPDGSFTAALPAAPSVSREEVPLVAGKVTRREYTVPAGASRTVVIGVTPDLVAAGNAAAFLRSAAQDSADRLGGTLVVSTDVVDDGTRSLLDFSVAYPGGLMKARALVVGTTLHLLTVVVGEPDSDPTVSASVIEGVFDNYRAA